MEFLSISVIAVVSFLFVPFLLILCADSKSDDGEPQVLSMRKKHSSARSKSDKNQNSMRSNGSAKRKSNGAVKEDTVIANGSAVQEGDVETGSLEKGVTAQNTYEEPEAFVTVEAGNRQSNGIIINGRPASSHSASVMNETSPANSNRSSRASSGHARNMSQDRALPEIPNTARHSAHSTNSERSPSTKRALPDIPAGEDGVYDQLERDLQPHQMKSKSSESSSVKNKQPQQLVLQDDDAESVEMIEPYEVTRSSVFVTTDPEEQYSSVTVVEGENDPQTSDASSTANTQASVKNKTKAPYTKVKKEQKTGFQVKSPNSEEPPKVAEEPIYADPPPVPVKLYDVEVEVAAADKAAADGEDAVALRGAAGGVAVDDNAQDSGSGYYTVTNDNLPGLPNMVNNPHPEIPESYDILTGRESIESVRARTVAEEEEDVYESMDDKGDEPAAPVVVVRKPNNANDLYAEIDNNDMSLQMNQSYNDRAASAHREELYAEIDTPASDAATTHSAVATLSVSKRPGDPGYEKVDFTTKPSAEVQTLDSAGYAIVKEANSSVANVPSTPDDEEDYAECDPLPQGGAATPRPLLDDSVAGSDPGYATVTFNQNKSGTSSNQKPPEPPKTPHPTSPPPGVAASASCAAPASSAASAGADNRPFQKYVRKTEHTYQEIDEVRMEKSPPDKRKKKDKDKK